MYKHYLEKKGRDYKLTKEFYDLSLKNKLEITNAWILDGTFPLKYSDEGGNIGNRIVLALLQHSPNASKIHNVKNERQLSAIARIADIADNALFGDTENV